MKIKFTILLIFLLTSTVFAQFGVKFQSPPGRRPAIFDSRLGKGITNSPILTNDLNGNGTPDIPMITIGSGGNDMFMVIDRLINDTLFVFPAASLPTGGTVLPDVFGFVRPPWLDGPAVLMAWTDLNESDPGVTLIKSADNQVLFAESGVQLLAVGDPDRDKSMDLVFYRLRDKVVQVVGKTSSSSVVKHSDSTHRLFSTTGNSNYTLTLKFESEPNRELGYNLDFLPSQGALDIDGDNALDITVLIEDASSEPVALVARDGGGNHDVKWQFVFPEEHKENLQTGFHGFFDVNGDSVKEAIGGRNLAVTLDGTVNVIDENLEILAVFDIDNDGLPELIGRGLADSTVQVWGATSPTSVSEEDLAIAGFHLQQNYPNPFNPSTTINYSIEKAGLVELKVYNLLGREVRSLINRNKPRGEFSVVWDGRADGGRRVASGHYFYQIKTGDFQSTKRMVLLK